ncbi:MAG: response regulator, partial [Nitrospirae bacterium]|nr:response regulator [Nitrospirota bacterium]
MSKLVLVVDDEEVIRDHLSDYLQNIGYRVVVAVDGEDGLKKAREQMPDLITLDIIMPKKTGIGVLEELRRDIDLWNVPVIMLSAVKNFIEQASKELDNIEIFKQMEMLMDNPDSSIDKSFLRFRSFRKSLLVDMTVVVEKFRKGELKFAGIPVLPDIFMDKPIEE